MKSDLVLGLIIGAVAGAFLVESCQGAADLVNDAKSEISKQLKSITKKAEKKEA